MYAKHRLQWKNPVDGISGVHAIGYPTRDEAYAAAAESSYELGWDGLTKPVFGPGFAAPSKEAERVEAFTFAAVLALVVAVLVRANLG